MKTKQTNTTKTRLALKLPWRDLGFLVLLSTSGNNSNEATESGEIFDTFSWRHKGNVGYNGDKSGCADPSHGDA